ncbi:MBL fold metallo-hydrolase [Actinoallomurus spadix]|uniref:MBL fold metallo-hydrolase n=1 Tax=Actinoallomurus spadix TaxID=79912 RepID=A0ABN0VTP5_9ACTN|nr:MBL fold metallo-hydrolase [Actinoallomurus spadix]MCO5987496.1 MBL fold metallo-hydrolase [Actinoallomurus spadix]
MTWHEIAERCFQRRYSDFDVTVGVVIGSAGAVVVDTRASVAQGVRLRDDLHALGVHDPAIVNTHGHFDHCFGNAAFTTGPRWGHASLPRYLAETARPMLAREFPGWAEKVETDLLLAPDRLVTGRAELDLGDRVAELRYFGPGHTDGDLVVWVPDARCAFTGDLIEQSGPPSYGADSFPLEWPATLTALLETVDGVLVPGHGAPVDHAFAARQRAEIDLVARRVRETHAEGLDVEEALAAGGWPYPAETLREAVRRGHDHLGRRSGPGRPPG